MTYSGPGTTTVEASNTYTGATFVNNGTLQLDSVSAISGNNVLGATQTANLNLNNGTLLVSATMALYSGTPGTGTDRPVVLGVGGGTFDVTGSNTLTISNTISGTGSLTKTDTARCSCADPRQLRGGFTTSKTGHCNWEGPGRQQGPCPRRPTWPSEAAPTRVCLYSATATASRIRRLPGSRHIGTGANNAVVGGNSAVSTLTYTGKHSGPFDLQRHAGRSGEPTKTTSR